MISKIRQLFNSARLNYISRKRKKILSDQIDKNKVEHLFKTVNCDYKWYGGSYGGFYINPSLLTSDSIVYSFGIGKDVSFDKTCIKKHKCRIFAFDPTPKSIDYIQNQVPSNLFTFFDFGITDTESGVIDFYLPVNPNGVSGSLVKTNDVNPNNTIKVKMKTFDDIVRELRHKHIDVIKMDIEGSEYAVLEEILASEIKVDQLLIEFHDRLFDQENYKSKKIVKKMNENGYEVFASSSTYEEVSFIHKRKLHINGIKE